MSDHPRVGETWIEIRKRRGRPCQTVKILDVSDEFIRGQTWVKCGDPKYPHATESYEVSSFMSSYKKEMQQT